MTRSRDMLRRRLTCLLMLLAVPESYLLAALPPYAQNQRDLDVMLDYLRQHREVMSALQMINLQTTTIHYGHNCTVTFRRQARPGPPMPGPAGPLRMASDSCSSDEDG